MTSADLVAASYQARALTIQPQGRVVHTPLVNRQRTILGLGMRPDPINIANAATRREGLGSIIDLIQSSMDNPVWNMDVVEQVRWTMLGPQTDQSINANFGAEIDLFGSGKS